MNNVHLVPGIGVNLDEILIRGDILSSNPTEIAARNFMADNRYAWILANKIVPSFCKKHFEIIKLAAIQSEGRWRLSIYAFNQIAIIPCVIASPITFFTTVTAAFVCGVACSVVLELKFPTLTNPKKDWKDYFESTAILKDDISSFVICALIFEMVANIALACQWPEKLVWYNALTGFMVGVVAGRMFVNRSDIRKMIQSIQGTEPLIPSPIEEV